MVAESLLIKHELLIINRSRRRAPALQPSDRVITGLLAAFIRPARLVRSAIVLKPSTIMRFHRALVRRKYRLLFTPKRRGKPGPKGPSPELIAAIVEMKRLWSADLFRCESLFLKSYWAMVVMDRFTRRIVGFAVSAGDLDGPAVCRMFNDIIGRRDALPHSLSTDHDPLFQFHRWKANLRILDVTGVNTVPYVPLSHPFVERLIGTIRREFLDLVPFWTTRDLERKLASFMDYYNRKRVHRALDGTLPDNACPTNVIRLNDYRWEPCCRGLYQLPAAA